MSDTDIFNAVLHTIDNNPTTDDGPRKVSVKKVRSRLAEIHGYDEDSPRLSQQLAATLKKWNGKLWRYNTTSQDGVPEKILVPETTVEDLRDSADK